MRYTVAVVAAKPHTDPALLLAQDATDACLQLMRADARARHPGASAKRIREVVEARLRRLRAAKLRAYRDNG